MWPSCFISKSNFKVKNDGTMYKVTRNTHVQYLSPISSGLKVMAEVKVFSKVGQTSRSRSQGKKLWYHVKGLATRNTHALCESPIISALKVIAKVKVFQSKSNFKVKRSKLMVPCERSCHKECTCAI